MEGQNCEQRKVLCSYLVAITSDIHCCPSHRYIISLDIRQRDRSGKMPKRVTLFIRIMESQLVKKVDGNLGYKGYIEFGV